MIYTCLLERLIVFTYLITNLHVDYNVNGFSGCGGLLTKKRSGNGQKVCVWGGGGDVCVVYSVRTRGVCALEY